LDRSFGEVDFAAIVRARMSGRGVLNSVEILKDLTKHVRKDFAALCGDSHPSTRGA
jgi:hypothetical protein